MTMVEQELLAQRISHILLEHMEPLESERLTPETSAEAAAILEQIRIILDNESLDDFNCVDEIVTLLQSHGIGTSRHDFG